jgi:hypothetical protein
LKGELEGLLLALADRSARPILVWAENGARRADPTSGKTVIAWSDMNDWDTCAQARSMKLGQIAPRVFQRLAISETVADGANVLRVPFAPPRATTRHLVFPVDVRELSDGVVRSEKTVDANRHANRSVQSTGWPIRSVPLLGSVRRARPPTL